MVKNIYCTCIGPWFSSQRSSREPRTFIWPPWAPVLTCIFIHTHMHPHILIHITKKYNIKKNLSNPETYRSFKHLIFIFFTFIYLHVCVVCMGVHILGHTCRGQKISQGSKFSSSNMWIIESKLELSSLMVNSFTSWTIFPAHSVFIFLSRPIANVSIRPSAYLYCLCIVFVSAPVLDFHSRLLICISIPLQKSQCDDCSFIVNFEIRELEFSNYVFLLQCHFDFSRFLHFCLNLEHLIDNHKDHLL